MSSTSFEWVCKKKSPSKHKNILPSTEVKIHPLKLENKPNRASDVFVLQDPLSCSLDGIDPLTQFTQESFTTLSPIEELSIDEWSSKKTAILNKYTTDEKLSMISSYLSGEEKAIKLETTTTIKKRLEQLDEFEDGSEREVGDLTPAEYIKQIELLKKELKQAWDIDQRVKALKITIQCSKLLVDTSAMLFYPSKFVLVSDILDLFGKLVFDRLKIKSEYYLPLSPIPTKLPDNFTASMVPESAKETCRNWFYKIASIRELVPRIYVEAAIIQCYRFLMDGELPNALNRLTKMVRGIGDPLVGAYARCYLCRVAASLDMGDFFLQNYNDFLLLYPHLLNKCVLGDLIVQKIDVSTYMCLYSPAIEWILNYKYIKSAKLNELFHKSSQMNNNGILLNSILNTFPNYFISENCLKFINSIAACTNKDVSQHILWCSLGSQLLETPPEEPLKVLRNVWGYISQIKDPSKYISCAKIWIKFVLKHFSSTELNWFLGDVTQYMTTSARIFEQHSSDLAFIMNTVLVYGNINILSLLCINNLLPYLELIKHDSKLEVCKNIMKNVMQDVDQACHIDDIYLVNTIMILCSCLHDSLNALSVQDERRQISEIICSFIYRVRFLNNPIQQLSFYVDARQAFCNLDSVLVTLVHCVNKLSSLPNSKCSRACAAYCFITIPSIECVWTQLQLYYLSAQVGLVNKCLGQVDACIKAALSLLLEVPEMDKASMKIPITEDMVFSYMKQMLSFLLIVPDNPEQSILYLTKALIKGINMYPWSTESTFKAELLIGVLDMLSSARQDSYPYAIKGVESNNILYGSDPQFIGEIDSVCTQVLELLLEFMQENKKHVGTISLQLFVRTILHTDSSINSLAGNLLKLCRKNIADEALLRRHLEYLKKKFPACDIIR